MILGDLNYYDQEYDDAIQHYRDAVQNLLENGNGKEKSLYDLVLLVRNMLKLGLCFEKKRILDSAFMIYGKITKLIIRHRHFELKNFSSNMIFGTAGVNREIRGERSLILEENNLGASEDESRFVVATADQEWREDRQDFLSTQFYFGQQFTSFDRAFEALPNTASKRYLSHRIYRARS